MNDTELSILNASVKNLTSFITAAHQTRNANLIGSHVKMLAAEPAPTDRPSSTDLNNILSNAAKVPSTTSIVEVPTTSETRMYQMLSQVQTLDSFISLLTAHCIYGEHPAPYNIVNPQEASAFARSMAKWRNHIITGGTVKAMAGYLPVGSIVSQHYSKETTRVHLHTEFLSKIFGDFGFPQKTLVQLDAILTKLAQQLTSIDISFEVGHDLLDHFLTYDYFDTVPGTGGKGEPEAMYIVKVRTFFLHVDQDSWRASINKSRVERFKFNMNYSDMTTTMNSALVASDMGAINTSIQKLTGNTVEEVNAMLNMQAIKVDPKVA